MKNNDTLSLLNILQDLKTADLIPQFLSDRNEDGWIKYSNLDFVEKIENCAKGLQLLGVKQGDKIALIANSCYDWLVIEFSILLLGGISVPMFANISKENMEFQLVDAAVDCLFIIGQEQWGLVACKDKLKYVITKNIENTTDNMMTLDFLVNEGKKQEESDLISKMLPKIKPKDLATIIYTSGTSGKPKGVCLSHQNLMHQVIGCQSTFDLNRQDHVLCCLPLAHIFQKTTVYYFLTQQSFLYFLDEISNLGMVLRELKPTAMIVVPRILEKVHQKIKQSVQANKGLKKKLASAAMHRAETKKIDEPVNFLDRIYQKVVYKKFLEATGGQFRLMVSGGAPLSEHVSRFLINIGIPLCQGYGLTETSPVVSTNTLKENKVGTVGPLFKGVQIRFLEDGEICVKSLGVMQGYLNNPEMTQEVMTEDGWFKTGDLGQLDKDGYLQIVGRKKELFKTSTGKYISPINIEQAVCESPLIDFSLAIAEGYSFVTALLFPSEEIVAQLNKNDISVSSYFNSKEVKEKLDVHINQVNKSLNEWEKIRYYKLIPQTLTIEKGFLTPKMSLRRAVLMKEFLEQIQNFYQV